MLASTPLRYGVEEQRRTGAKNHRAHKSHSCLSHDRTMWKGDLWKGDLSTTRYDRASEVQEQKRN